LAEPSLAKSPAAGLYFGHLNFAQSIFKSLVGGEHGLVRIIVQGGLECVLGLQCQGSFCRGAFTHLIQKSLHVGQALEGVFIQSGVALAHELKLIGPSAFQSVTTVQGRQALLRRLVFSSNASRLMQITAAISEELMSSIKIQV
jgi:hypothetical protein